MWGGGGGVGGMGVIIMYYLNRVRLSCCWVGVGLGCDNNVFYIMVYFRIVKYTKIMFSSTGAQKTRPWSVWTA